MKMHGHFEIDNSWSQTPISVIARDVRAVRHTVQAMMANRRVVTRPKDEEMADDHGKESKQHRRLHLNQIVLATVRLY